MKVSQYTIKPDAQRINPSIKINLKLEYTNRGKEIVPIYYEGHLLSEDEKILGETHFHFTDPKKIELAAKDPNKPDNVNLEHEIAGSFDLTELSINHLQQLRQSNVRNDVVMKLKLTVRYLERHIVLSSIEIEKTGDTENLIYNYTNKEYHTSMTNLWILSGDGGRRILNVISETKKFDLIISSSDWIHEFTEILRIGKFIIFEIPMITNIEYPDNEELKSSIDAINNLKILIQKGEWRLVMKESRESFEILRNVKIIEKCFESTHSKEAISEFSKTMNALFQYTSKFIHPLNRSGEIKDEETPNREDAYFAYLTTVGAFNSLTTKLKRIQQSVRNSKSNN